MIQGINLDILFDRPLTKEDYISPGLYSLKLTNSKEVTFDFTDYYGSVDKTNPAILHIEHLGLDKSFCDKEHYHPERFINEDCKNILSFSEIFIYAEHNDIEDVDLKIKSILKASLVVDDEEYELSEKQRTLL